MFSEIKLVLNQNVVHDLGLELYTNAHLATPAVTLKQDFDVRFVLNNDSDYEVTFTNEKAMSRFMNTLIGKGKTENQINCYVDGKKWKYTIANGFVLRNDSTSSDEDEFVKRAKEMDEVQTKAKQELDDAHEALCHATMKYAIASGMPLPTGDDHIHVHVNVSLVHCNGEKQDKIFGTDKMFGLQPVSLLSLLQAIFKGK